VVVCLEQGADLHMFQLMPLPLAVSCFSKIQIGFTFLVPAYLGTPGKSAVKRMCVCAWLSDTKMLRLLPPAYGDGVYAPSGADRPNAHDIARAVFDGDTGSPSNKNRTALLVFFGEISPTHSNMRVTFSAP